MKPHVHLFILFAILSLWTWKLLEAAPVPETLSHRLSSTEHLVLSKSLHAGMYAFLALLGTSRFPRHALWVVALLMLHGASTEFAQHTMNLGRSGKLTDVLIDWAGIMVGVLGARRFLKP